MPYENITTEAIAKIKAAKDSKIQYIKDEATEAEKVGTLFLKRKPFRETQI